MFHVSPARDSLPPTSKKDLSLSGTVHRSRDSSAAIGLQYYYFVRFENVNGWDTSIDRSDARKANHCSLTPGFFFVVAHSSVAIETSSGSAGAQRLPQPQIKTH